MHVDFYHFQYFGLILVKMKAFQKNLFINILRIESSTSSEIFIKIGHHFGMTWLSSCGMTLFCSLTLMYTQQHIVRYSIR